MDKDSLEYLKGFEIRINEQFHKINERFDNIDKQFEEVKQDIVEVKNKLDATYDQVYNLTEFKTEVIIKIDNISENMEFLGNKAFQNERAVFVLSNKIRK